MPLYYWDCLDINFVKYLLDCIFDEEGGQPRYTASVNNSRAHADVAISLAMGGTATVLQLSLLLSLNV